MLRHHRAGAGSGAMVQAWVALQAGSGLSQSGLDKREHALAPLSGEEAVAVGSTAGFRVQEARRWVGQLCKAQPGPGAQRGTPTLAASSRAEQGGLASLLKPAKARYAVCGRRSSRFHHAVSTAAAGPSGADHGAAKAKSR